MRKTVVFMSSTIYDLREERKAVYELLNNSGYIPLANEYPSFDIGDGKHHSYRICLDNVESSDVVIAILGHRCGGLMRYDGRQIPITLAEIMHGIKSNKVVYVFCAQSASDERIKFKRALAHYPSKEEAFLAMKGEFRSDSYRVFDNIDSITKLTHNNWITFFVDRADLLTGIQSKLAGYNLDRLQRASVNYTGVVNMLKHGADLSLELYDSSYDKNRESSKKILDILGPFVDQRRNSYSDLSNATTFDIIKRYYAANTEYANRTGMESAERCVGERGKVFYGFDTQMEQNSLSVWTRDRSFQRYLFFTSKLARKKPGRHFRIFLFENARFISDNLPSIYMSVIAHLSCGIVPIITTYPNIPYDIPFNLMNCNALYGERVLVVILPVGLTMLFTKENNHNRLRLYDDSFQHVLSLAKRSCGAARIDSPVSYSEFVAQVCAVEFDGGLVASSAC